MSDLYNFHIPSSETEEKPSEITPPETDANTHKIRHIIHKNKQDRSQSAPLEEVNNDDDAEFLSSYNYYLFYMNKNPRDPHLPKPTYVPKPDLGDIKESKPKDEEDQPKINNDKQMETLNQMMNNLNLDKSINMNFSKLLNDDFQSDTINNKLGINNNNVNEFNNNNNIYNSNNKSKLLNLNLNSNNNNNINSLSDNLNNKLPQNIQADLFGDDNFILNNFVNNDNIKNIVSNNQKNINNDNNINNMGSSLSFNPNNVNNMYGNKGIGFNEFDIYNSNKMINNNNVNNNNTNNNNLINMMLLQNMQKDQNPNLNPNFNINYFNQKINNNNILLNNINNNSKQGNFEPNYNNILFQNNFPNLNRNNNFMNYNSDPSPNPNYKNYQNLFSKNNQKRKYQNNNNNNFNNRNQNMNMNMNANNINPKFFPPKNQKFNNNIKNIAGLSDFTNSQKRDLTDIKHLEELIQSAINIQSNLNNSNNNINNSPTEANGLILLNQYKTEILNLSKDVTGNYAVQKVLNNKKIHEVNFIIESLKNNIYKLTLNLYGCRCVQELISILSVENMSIITNELKPFYDNCIQDKNGNHVIQKLIEKVDKNDLNDIYLVAVNNIIYLSKHQYGCRVIQRLFKYCNKKQIQNMLNSLFNNINDLIQDQYGNYVIQFILENQEINKDDLLPIFYSLKGNIYQYSFHKYASNVVERCITFGNDYQKREIINEIVELVRRDEEIIINMVRDKFANYVVQKIIEFSDSDIQQYLINIILSRQNKIKNEGFSKHVLNFIEKLNSGNIKGNKIKNNNIYKPFK